LTQGQGTYEKARRYSPARNVRSKVIAPINNKWQMSEGGEEPAGTPRQPCPTFLSYYHCSTLHASLEVNTELLMPYFTAV
jgi:hypothetical protein